MTHSLMAGTGVIFSGIPEMGQGSEGLAGLGEAKEQVCARIPQQLLPTFKSR